MKGLKKKRSRIKIFILFFCLIILVTFIIFFPPIVIYSSRFFINKFGHRNLKIEKIDYSPFKGILQINNIKLLTQQEIVLFSVKKVYLDINLLKTLTLKPSITKIILDSPYTYLEKKGNNFYQLPEYFTIKNTKKDSGQPFILPINIEHFELLNGILNIKENNREKQLITALNIIIPRIDLQQKSEIKPVISGNIFGKKFYLAGKTRLTNDTIINEFKLSLRNFNLTEISPYIPAINKIKIISGFVNADVNISVIIPKKSATSVLISGLMNVRGLYLNDSWVNRYFLEDISGQIILNKYDILNRYMDINQLSLYSGKLALYYSRNPAERSIFFNKKDGKGSGFKFSVKSLSSDRIRILFYNRINQTDYDFFNSSVQINDYQNNSDKDVSFKLSSNANGLNTITANGFFNLSRKLISFDQLLLTHLDLTIFKILPENFNVVKQGIISSYNGNLFIGSGRIMMKGIGVFENTKILVNENNIWIKKGLIELNQLDSSARTFSLNYFVCEGAGIPLNKNGTMIQNLTFELKKSDKPYTFVFGNNLNLTHDLHFININGQYAADDLLFDFKAQDLHINAKLNLNLKPSLQIEGSGTLNLIEPVIYTNKNPVLKIQAIDAVIDKIKLFPLYLNLREMKVGQPYFIITVKKDTKLYFLSLFEYKSHNVSANTEIILNIDRILLDNGTMIFSDYSLNKNFNLEITSLNGEIVNLPSNVYPEGNINATGIINNRDKIIFQANIAQSGNISGRIAADNLSLQQFSPYTEKYLGYQIANGSLNLISPFEIKQNLLNADFNLVMNNLIFIKILPDKNKINLEKIMPLLEDNKGNIVLTLPVRGKWGSPNIDFRSIFFDLFLEIVSNSGNDLNVKSNKFKNDTGLEIIYFKPGSDQFILNPDRIFSTEMINRFNDQKKIFMIEGFVDKKKDEPYIKEQILKEKIQVFSSNPPEENNQEEITVLKQVYQSLTDDPLPDPLDRAVLKNMILDKLVVDDTLYYALSFKRIIKVKELLMNTYHVKSSRILTSEKSIFENPYITGIDNTIAVLQSGSQ